jgi:RNA polymerase sigma factor (sigma-70 family)
MSKATYTDLEFLQGLKQNNDVVLRALYKKYYGLVLKYVVSNSGSSEAAADIYQETIIVLYENVQKEHFELNCQLQTFIFSVAKRLWLKQLRDFGKIKRFDNEDEADIVDVSEEISHHLQKESDIAKMNSCMEQIGEPCKTLLKDFYVYKMSMDEISEKFGYTNSDNAKTQKYKCLQRLKKYFFEDEIKKKQDLIQ